MAKSKTQKNVADWKPISDSGPNQNSMDWKVRNLYSTSMIRLSEGVNAFRDPPSPRHTSDIYKKFCRRAYRRKSEQHCQERFLDLALETEDEGHGFDDWHSRETSRRANTKNFGRDSISYILYVRLSVWSSAASKNYAGKNECMSYRPHCTKMYSIRNFREW